MNGKILSVIVPSYNMEKYLPKCLGSMVVAPELMCLLEVLVVNDGSTDRTSDVAHEFASKWPQTFKVFDKVNGHYGSCINTALPEVTGKYVKILDADDSFDRMGFKGFLHFLMEMPHEVDLVLSDFVLTDENDQVTEECEVPFPAGILFPIDQFLRASSAILMPSYTYRADIFNGLAYHQMECMPYTDSEWIFTPLVRVKTCIRYPQILYRYLRARTGQTTNSGAFAKNWGSYGSVVLDMVKQFQKVEYMASEPIREILRKRLQATVEAIYRGAMFGIRGRRANIDLHQFDSNLLSLNDSLYEAVGNLAYSRRLPYRFVRAWRKDSVWYVLMMLVCRCYSRCCYIMKLCCPKH